jgi:hypothetical protein
MVICGIRGSLQGCRAKRKGDLDEHFEDPSRSQPMSRLASAGHGVELQ